MELANEGLVTIRAVGNGMLTGENSGLAIGLDSFNVGLMFTPYASCRANVIVCRLLPNDVVGILFRSAV